MTPTVLVGTGTGIGTGIGLRYCSFALGRDATRHDTKHNALFRTTITIFFNIYFTGQTNVYLTRRTN